MCGRYVIARGIREIEKEFGLDPIPGIEAFYSYNVSPGQMAIVWAGDQPERLQIQMFGLTPFWAKKKMYLFNARAEGNENKDNDPSYSGPLGITGKPAFKHALKYRRCIVWANAFIEGPQKEKLSKPYAVFCDEKEIFALAGIWDEWIDKESGEILRSFSIITTTANEITQKIGHHRSPVILQRGTEKLWIDPKTPHPDILSMLKPYDGKMYAFPIDPAIKNPRAEGPQLLMPIGTQKDVLRS